MVTDYTEFRSRVRAQVFYSKSTAFLLMSCLPLMVASESIVLPVLWFAATYHYRYRKARQEALYFSH